MSWAFGPPGPCGCSSRATPCSTGKAAWSPFHRDRLHAVTTLAVYHMPGAPRPAQPPFVVAPVRALMARTLPRRDFLKASRWIKRGQQIQPEALQRAWVDIGYKANEIVIRTRAVLPPRRPAGRLATRQESPPAPGFLWG